MSSIKHFIEDAILREEIDAFFAKELDRAGYSRAEIARTPLGARITIYAMKPGIVIGRRGVNIRELTRVVEERFKLSNPQIAVSELEAPELNARVMASRMVDALQRGVHFRRTGFWALNQIMRAEALGVEIRIKGKLRTRRHRSESFRAGYMPRSGDPAIKNTRVAVTHVKLKQGILGITVKIVPPDAIFPDRVHFNPPTSKEQDEDIVHETREVPSDEEETTGEKSE